MLVELVASLLPCSLHQQRNKFSFLKKDDAINISKNEYKFYIYKMFAIFETSFLNIKANLTSNDRSRISDGLKARLPTMFKTKVPFVC